MPSVSMNPTNQIKAPQNQSHKLTILNREKSQAPPFIDQQVIAWPITKLVETFLSRFWAKNMILFITSEETISVAAPPSGAEMVGTVTA